MKVIQIGVVCTQFVIYVFITNEVRIDRVGCNWVIGAYPQS